MLDTFGLQNLASVDLDMPHLRVQCTMDDVCSSESMPKDTSCHDLNQTFRHRSIIGFIFKTSRRAEHKFFYSCFEITNLCQVKRISKNHKPVWMPEIFHSIIAVGSFAVHKVKFYWKSFCLKGSSCALHQSRKWDSSAYHAFYDLFTAQNLTFVICLFIFAPATHKLL